MERPSEPSDVWIGTAAALIGFSACALPIVSYDYWWHLAAGRWILENGAVPRADPFSHSLPGVRWIDFEWLFQVLLFLVRRAGGDAGAMMLSAAASGTALAAVYAAAREAGASRSASLLAAAGALHFVKARSFAQPESATIVFLPLFLWAVLRQRRTAPDRSPWFLAALTILWANLHGGFIYGIGLLALTGHIRLAALSLGAAAINPYGIFIFEPLARHLMDLFSSEASGIGGIQEWAPTGLLEFPFFWGVLLASFLALPAEIRFGRFFWIAPILVFGIWGSLQARNPILFALVSLPFLAERLETLGESVRRPAAGLAVLVFSAFLLQSAGRRPGSVRWERLPKNALDFLEKENPPGKAFADYEFGGYWTWRFGQSRPVYFDGRYLFHGLLAEVRRAREVPGGFAALMDERGIDVAVAGYGREAFPERFPRDRWALVYWDDTAMVFLRRKPEWAKRIAELEYRVLNPERLESFDPRAADFEIERRAHEGPFSVRAEFFKRAAGSRP